MATVREVMSLALGEAALQGAVESIRAGGYPKPTDEQFVRLGRMIAVETLAMPHLVSDMATASVDQLEGAARDLGALVVAQVLGPPPRAN